MGASSVLARSSRCESARSRGREEGKKGLFMVPKTNRRGESSNKRRLDGGTQRRTEEESDQKTSNYFLVLTSDSVQENKKLVFLCLGFGVTSVFGECVRACLVLVFLLGQNAAY